MSATIRIVPTSISAHGPLGVMGLRQRGSDRVHLHGGRGRLVAGTDQNGFVTGSTSGRTSTPPPGAGAGHSLAISIAWSRSRASMT